MTVELIVAQITDCHLFSHSAGLHHGCNVYSNLVNVLQRIKQLDRVDVIVFTGDLTQDHSEESYQLFVSAFETTEITTPVYFLAGNHDEPELLELYLASKPFHQGNIIETTSWQILLVASKSETPAGFVSEQQFDKLNGEINGNKAQLLLMHHHPVNVGFFIDRHGLKNKTRFHQFINEHSSIAAVGCGHVHQALTLPITLPAKNVPLFTCPATSIQFDKHSDTVAKNGQGPGFQCFTLKENRQLSSEVFFL